MQLGYPILSILTLLPIAGIIVTAFVPKESVKMIRGITVATGAIRRIKSGLFQPSRVTFNADAGIFRE